MIGLSETGAVVAEPILTGPGLHGPARVERGRAASVLLRHRDALRRLSGEVRDIEAWVRSQLTFCPVLPPSPWAAAAPATTASTAWLATSAPSSTRRRTRPAPRCRATAHELRLSEATTADLRPVPTTVHAELQSHYES